MLPTQRKTMCLDPERCKGMSFHSPPSKQTPAPTLPTYSARDLTEGGDLAQINLDGQNYTLRITRAGKLILTK